MSMIMSMNMVSSLANTLMLLSLVETVNGSVHVSSAASGGSFPGGGGGGSLYTKNGFDNIMGMKAICWSAQAFLPDETHSQEIFSSEVAAANELVSRASTMMYECPSGVDIHLEPPVEATRGKMLRTQRSYRFEMTASINMTSIREEFGLSNETEVFPVAGRVVFCPPNGNLCSPFVVAQSHAAFHAASGHDPVDHGMGDEGMGDEGMHDQEGSSAHEGHGGVSSSSGEQYSGGDDHGGGTPAAGGNMISHDSFDLALLEIVESSSKWQFQTMPDDDDDDDGIVIIHMVFETFIHQPGSYLPLGKLIRIQYLFCFLLKMAFH
jgi:hypothetical protein